MPSYIGWLAIIVSWRAVGCRKRCSRVTCCSFGSIASGPCMRALSMDALRRAPTAFSRPYSMMCRARSYWLMMTKGALQQKLAAAQEQGHACCLTGSARPACGTMRFGSTAKAQAKRVLKYYGMLCCVGTSFELPCWCVCKCTFVHESQKGAPG